MGQVDAALAGRGAVSVTWDPAQGQSPTVDVAVRLDVAGRLAYLGFEGMIRRQILDGQTTEWGLLDHRGRIVLVSIEGAEQSWAVSNAGDVLLFSTDVQRLAALLDQADFGGDQAAPEALALARKAGFPEDHRAYLYVDGDRLRDAVVEWAADQEGGAAVADMIESVFALSHYGVAFYLDDAFERFEVRSVATISGKTSDAMRRLYRDPGSGELRTWRSMPEETFLWGGARMDMQAYWDVLAESLPGEMGTQFDEGIQGFEEQLGMSLENELMPALGPEFGVAVGFGAEPAPPANAPPGMPPLTAVPAVTVRVESRADEVVRKFVDKLVKLGNEETSDRYAGQPGKPEVAPDLFVRERYQDVEYVTMALTDEDRSEMPISIQPALGISDGFLTLCLDVKTFREIVDTGAGRRKSFRDSSVVARAEAAGVNLDAKGVGIMDWDGFVDQLHQYGRFFGQAIPEGEQPPFPEYPENDDMDEWNRRVRAYNEAKQKADARSAEAAPKYIDSLRLVDFVVSTNESREGMEVSRMVVRFR
jgi:hypothetical protein